MEKYKVKHEEVRFGRDEVNKRTFKKVETDAKIWYIPIQENPADDLHVFIKTENTQLGGFRGYGGATLNFLLEDDTIDAVQGPWHSNPDSLLADTGIDLKDKSLTFGVIARERIYEGNDTILNDVLYKDAEWVVGKYTRIKELAQTFANVYEDKIYYYTQSTGGSTLGWMDPEKFEPEND
jgi:hypothetical protein